MLMDCHEFQGSYSFVFNLKLSDETLNQLSIYISQNKQRKYAPIFLKADDVTMYPHRSITFF